MGIKLLFDVNGSVITRRDINRVAGNSINFVEAQFSFDESWNGLPKTAVFENMSGSAYSAVLEDGICDVPHEALAVSGNGGGFMYVSVLGVITATDTTTTPETVTVSQRGTANKVHIPLEPNGATESANSGTPTATVPEQVISALAKGQWKTGTAVGGTGSGISATVDGAAVGMHYINEGTSNVYECTAVSGTASTWNYVCSFKGIKGDTGNAGKDLVPINTEGQFTSWKYSISPGTRGVCIVCVKFSSGDTDYVPGDVICCDRDGLGVITLTKYSLKGADGTNGTNGDDGITPTIGANGNWYLGTTDTGLPSRGEKGDTGAAGANGAPGANGSPGTNGVSPAITITEYTASGAHGHTVTIVDAAHPQGQSFNIVDGVNGQDGNNFLVYDLTNSLDNLYSTYGQRTVTMLWLGENEDYPHYEPYSPQPVWNNNFKLIPYQVYYVNINKQYSGAAEDDVQTLYFSEVSNIKGVKGDTGDTGATGAQGSKGDTGNGIASAVLNADYTLTITFTDGTSYTTPSSIRGATGANGADGEDGTTFTPSVSSAGVISWTNDGGKQNPTAVNIKGANGTNGADGADGVSPAVVITPITGGHQLKITDATHPSGQTFTILDGTNGRNGTDGADGEDGTTFTPSVSSAGVISWTNDGGKTNPTAVNIKGANGTNGADGADGVSPAVVITPITGGHQLKITDAAHPSGQTFTILDGTNGRNGQDGADGENGEDGTTFTPSVSSAGVISWTNDGGKTNPQSVDLVTAVINALPSAVGVSF